MTLVVSRKFPVDPSANDIYQAISNIVLYANKLLAFLLDSMGNLQVKTVLQYR